MASHEETDDQTQCASKEQLPEDLVHSVVLNLPAKTLLQFPCLSKKWCQLIPTRSFNLDRLKLQQSGNTSFENPAVKSIIQFYRYMNRSRSICLTGTVHRFRGNELKPHDSFNIKLPFGVSENVPEADRFYVSELSCDGMLCIVYKSSNLNVSNHRIYLWNPYARKFKNVSWPEEFKDDCYADNIFIGFGYDSSVGGYKIVVMKSSTTSYSNWRILVTCLKSDDGKNSVWRKVEIPLSLPHNIQHAHQCFRHVTIQEDIYWICKNKSDNSRYILKFNLKTENLATLPMPSEVIERLKTQIPNPELEEIANSSGRQSRIRLGHRNNECLYLYHYNAYPDYKLGSPVLEIWKHCNGFRKVMSVPETAFNEAGLIVPIGFTINGDFIISCYAEESLAAYIPQQGKLEHLKTGGYMFWPKNANKIAYAFVDNETLIAP